jgi:hypothetical protein
MYFNDCFFNSCQSHSDSCSIHNKTGQTLRANSSKECHHHCLKEQCPQVICFMPPGAVNNVFIGTLCQDVGI